MGILAIVLIVKGLKRLCGKGGYLEKRKESKLQRDAAKFEKLRIRFEKNGEKDKVDLKEILKKLQIWGEKLEIWK